MGSIAATIRYNESQRKLKEAQAAAQAKRNADLLASGYVVPTLAQSYAASQAQKAGMTKGEIAQMIPQGTLFATGKTYLKENPGDYEGAQAAQQKQIEADRMQAEQRARSGAVGATSEAAKQRETRAVAASQGIAVGSINGDINFSVDSILGSSKQPTMITPKTNAQGGTGYTVKLNDSVNASSILGQPNAQGGQDKIVKLKDSVGVSGEIGGQYGPTPKAIPKGAAYFVLGPVSGEPNMFSLNETDYRNYGVYGPPTKPEKQDYPRSYGLENITPENVLKGAEGGARSLLQNILTPKPIISDIFGTTNDKQIGRVVVKIEKVVKPGKTLSGSTIEQLATGKALTGTGEGLGYDIGSLGFDVATSVLPLKSPIKVPAFKAVVEGGEVKTIARSLQLLGRNVLTKTEGGFNIGGPLRNLEKSALAKIEGSIGKSTMEFGTQGKYTEKILTSEKGMNILKQAGKALDRDLRFVPNQKRAAEIVKFSEKNIPDVARKQADYFPPQPVKTIPPGIESETLLEEVIGTTKVPIKGTLAETMQLGEDVLKSAQPKGSLEGLNPMNVRSGTTSDIDISYAEIKYGLGRVAKTKTKNPLTGAEQTKLSYVDVGIAQAEKAAEKYTKALQKVAGKGRQYQQKGTNVQVSEKDGNFETVINIVTKRDRKTGYLNEQKGKVFGQDLGRKIIKFPIKKGSSAKGPVISLESQALRRIESYVSLKGPLSEKYMGAGEPDYLKPGRQLKKTEKGYGFSSDIYRLKDIVKNTRNLEQIARNLKLYGFENQAKELRAINQQTMKDFDELDFGLNIPEKPEFANDIPSLTSYVGSKIKSPTQSIGIASSKIQPGKSDKISDEYGLGKKSSTTSKLNKSLQDLVSKSIVQPRQQRQSYPTQQSQSSVIKTSLANIGNLSNIGSKVGKSKGRSGSSSSLGVSFGSVTGSPSKTSPGSPSNYGIPDYYPVTPYYGQPPYYGPPPPGGGGKPPGSPTGSSLSLGRITKVPPPTTRIPTIKIPRIKLYEQRRARRVPVYSKNILFISGPADPTRVGVSATALGRYTTIPELRSRSPKVFKDIDKLLKKARRRKSATRPLTF